MHHETTAGKNTKRAVDQDRQRNGGNATDDAGQLARFNGVGTERRPNGTLLNDRQFGRQGARAQLDRQLVASFTVKLPLI